ncbi:hypothetical protein ScPMuIL_001517 [Solemya velum]
MGTEIPRLFPKLYKKRWRQDPKIILFPPQSAKEVKSQIVVVPQPHQLIPKELLKNKDEKSSSLKLNLVITSVTVVCLYWEENTEEWTDDGCQGHHMMDSTSPKCAICGEILDDGRKTVKITDKGAESVNSASYARENKSIQVQAGQTVHTSCRLDYCNKKSIKSAMKRKLHVDVPENRILRSQEPKFTFLTHCFLCGIYIDQEAKDDDFYMVRTWDFQKSIVKTCDDRNDDDEWAEKIRGRLAFAVDLPAVEAIYHQVCNINFRTGKQIPRRYRNDTEGNRPPKLGRRSDISREKAFLQVIDELRENDDEQSTVSDLFDRMSKICSDPYGPTYIRQKLAEHLGDSVVISNINGKDNVVTFRTTAAKILQTFYENPKMNDENAEKRRIINAATEFIKADIKNIETSKLSYPNSDKLGSLEENLEYLPDSLRLLLNNLFTGKPIDLKVATIGQCIVQATRPRVVLAPIVFGLGVQMHHLYGSRSPFETIVIDPQLLFQRLLIVAKSTSGCNVNDLFKYELSGLPTSLFDEHGLLRDPQKPQLADALAALVSTDHPQKSKETAYHVLDGGSLIHRFPWKKGETYEVICDMYVNYVLDHYSNAIAVFDGYTQGPSTKDMTHLKRAEGKAGPRVLFAPSMPLKSKKEQFLANIENKQQFINLLSEKMNEKGIRTVSAEGDADVLIAETGVKCSDEGLTYVIGEDTDVLVLLCHYSKDDSKGLLFRSDRKTSKRRVWDISLVRQTLGTELCRMLPVIHSIGGCDTTSRLFGIGKGSALKKTQTVMSFKEHIGILCESELNTVEVQNAGEKNILEFSVRVNSIQLKFKMRVKSDYHGFLVFPAVYFLSGSPVVLGTLIVVWLIYLPLLYWARKKDKYLSKEIVFRLADNHPADHYQYFVQIVVGKQMITKRPSRLFLKIFGEKSTSSTHLLCANYVSGSRTERDSGRFVLTTPVDLADPSIPRINRKVLQDIVQNLPTKLDMKSKTHVSTDTRDVYKPLTDSIIQPVKSRLETSSSEEETSLSEVNISSKKVDWNSVKRKQKKRYSFKMTRKSRISFEDRNARFSHSLENVQPAITRARVSLSWTNLVGNREQSQVVQNHLGVSNNDILYGQGDITSTRQNDLETTSIDTNSNAVQDGGIFAHLSPKITRCVQDSCIGAGSEASAKVDSGRFQTFKALDEYTGKIRCEQFGQIENSETKDMPNMLNNCSYRDTDIENSFRVKQVAEHMFVDARYNGNVPLNKVRTSEDMVVYLKTSVMGNLFVKTEYGYITSSQVSCLISNIHIRQKRVRSGFCDAESLKRIIGEFECWAPFSENGEDQASYNTSWSTLDLNKHSDKTAWTFQSNDYLQSVHHVGDHAIYSAEGFIFDLPWQDNQTEELINFMKHSSWLDSKTRAVFIEFVLYNPSIKHFSLIMVLFEYTMTGDISPSFHIHSMRNPIQGISPW